MLLRGSKMAHSFKYSVLRVIPDSRRGECVNVGLVVFLDDAVDVRVLSSLAKVAALNGAVDLEELRTLPSTISEWVPAGDIESRHASLRNLGVVSVTELGQFETDGSPDSYDAAVRRLMKALVTPIPAETRLVPPNTRIVTTLKAKFRANRVLGSGVDDITKHLVVPNYPIDEDEGLFADFVVKNGAYHITETADLRAASASNIDRVRIASLAAIKLDRARQMFGKSTKRFVVYASRRGAPAQAENLIGQYADAIFHLDSKKEMASYMERIMNAASPTHAIRSS
jgi:hypothetical protein